MAWGRLTSIAASTGRAARVAIDVRMRGNAAPCDSSSSSGSAGTYCDACSADAPSCYSETIDTSGTYAKRTIASNGCPNHCNCTGKDAVPLAPRAPASRFVRSSWW